MPTFTAIELLQALVALPAALLATFLIWRRSLWPLAVFLALLALQMVWGVAVAHRLPVPEELGAGLDLAYGPLMLALVRYLGWRQHPGISAAHALPAVLMPPTLMLWPSLSQSVWWIVGISATAYVARGLLELARYHRELRATHSAFEAHSLHWLRTCLWLLLAVVVLDIFRVLLRTRWPEMQSPLTALIYVGALVFVCVLVWRGLQQPLQFAGLPAEAADLTVILPVAAVNDAESRDALGALAHRIQSHLRDAEPHLDPDLTVQMLADHLGVPAKQVSLAINHVLGRNFNDLINAARVETACRLLSDPKRCRDKLLSIQIDSGFGSRTVFNAAFKRETGATPSEWRRRQRLSAPAAGKDERQAVLDVRNQDP